MSNILTYIPTYLNITNLLDGYIAIYDNTSTQQYYLSSNQNIELPYEATGSWSYKITRYGYKLISGVFTVDRNAGGTVNISPTYTQDIYVSDIVNNVSAYNVFSKTQEIYDYLSYYRTTSAGLGYGDQNLYSNTLDIGSNNIVIYDSAIDPFSYDGSTFVLKCNNLSGAAIKTSGNFTISGSSSISDISITSNVIDQTPANLTNVKIFGILSYNTNTSASIVYTNTTVDTVVNNGTATVLIERINSSINNATDPEIDNYAPTVINITPNGGSVAIYNDTNTREYFVTTNSSLVLTPAASGTWAYRVAKYACDSIYQTFVVNRSTGGTVNITPNYVTDLFATDTLSSVSAYTDLNTSAKIHDYLSYYQTTSSGIDYGDIESETFGTMTFNSDLTLDATASSIVDYTGGVLTLKSTNLVDNIVFSINGDFNQLNGNTVSLGIKIRANNLDSEIILTNTNSITLYPSDSARDSNLSAGPTFSDIFRFKYGNTYSGVSLSGVIYARVDVNTILLYSSPISKGTTTLDLGIQGQLVILGRNQGIINTGVQKASKLIPHTTNL